MFTSKLLAFGLMCFDAVWSQNCPEIVTRREIRELSNLERTRLFDAITKLHNTNGNVYEGYTQWHLDYNSVAHNKPAFLPWHRQFIFNFERNLQEIDPRIVLPYWDWTRDYEYPHRSIIFSNSYLGGNGRRGDNCVVNGVFANWNLVSPNSHCLRRDFADGATLPEFSSPQEIEAILHNTQSYDEFRSILEYPSHGIVHNYIGGKYGDFSTMYSSNDPIFYLHHVFIDLLWNEWQLRHPNLALTYNGGSSRPTDNMPPFNVPVHSTFRTTNFCYRYPRYSANLPRFTENVSQNPEPIRALRSLIQTDSLQPLTTTNNTTRPPPTFSKLHTFINKLNRLPKPISSPDVSNSAKVGKPKKFIKRKKPLTEEFIRSNHLNREEIRGNERIMANLVDAINQVNIV